MTDVELTYQPSWRQGPFGNSDASRVDATPTYIEIPGVAPSLKSTANRLRHRVIIGRKGAGKTHYLRALRDSLAKSDVYVYRQIDFLRTDDVLSVNRAAGKYHSQLITESPFFVDPYFYIREFWKVAWDRAIYASVLSILGGRNSGRDLPALVSRDSIKEEDWARLLKLLPEIDIARSPANMLSAFINRTQGFNSLRRFLYSPEWDFARFVADALIPQAPPLAIIVDAIDDDFESAPEPWLYCQDGLFKAIIGQLNESNQFSNRVHIISALRDVVYSSLFQSDHALRYVGDEHILKIRWDYRTSREFLNAKASQLVPASVLRRHKGKQPVEVWLGRGIIQNVARKQSEQLVEYMLRHTRLLPRDIVILGNALAEKFTENQAPDESEIRAVVHKVAQAIANEALQTAVNEALMSKEYVADLMRQVNSSLQSADGADIKDTMRRIAFNLRADLHERIARFFSLIATETFTYETLTQALVESGLAKEEDFGGVGGHPYRFDHILWRQGLIGHRDGLREARPWQFYQAGDYQTFLLPSEAGTYGVHSILLDRYRTLIAKTGSSPIF